MKPATKELVESIRKKLLALPDRKLTQQIEEWAMDRWDNQIEDEGEWVDLLCTHLDYRIQNTPEPDGDGKIYSTLTAYQEATTDDEDSEWQLIPPPVTQLRSSLANLSVQQFDQIVLETAFQALHEEHQEWGIGQDFLWSLYESLTPKHK